MKKIRFVLFIVLFMPIATLCSGQSPTELIAKKWVFKEMDEKQIDAMVAQQIEVRKKEYEGIADSAERALKVAGIKKREQLALEQINEMFRNLTFEFKQDGTCETGGRKDKKIEKGKWTLSNDEKKIFIINDQNKKQEFAITKLTSDELTIGMPTGSGSIHLSFIRSRTPKEMITKKWVFKEIDKKSLDTVIAKKFAKEKDRYSEISDSAKKADIEMQIKYQMKTKTIEDYKSLTWDIKADGSCKISIMDKVETGIWELSEDGKKLTMTDKERLGRMGHFNVIKLTNDELSILMKQEGIEIEMVFSANK